MGKVVLDSLLSYRKGPDIIKILDKETGDVLYKGYKGLLPGEAADFLTEAGVKYVKEYRAYPEITHKEWRKKGLIAPMLPEALPQYQFQDMRVDLIYEYQI